MNRIDELKKMVIDGYRITMDDATELAGFSGNERLYDAADEIRSHFCSDRFELCSIINAKSGGCSEDCKWCSQSMHHSSEIALYDSIDTDEAVRQALYNESKGVRRISLVTSGRGLSSSELDVMTGICRSIKKSSGIRLCASMGLIDAEGFLWLKNAGVERYHCNLETSRSFFASLCTTHTYDDKIRAIREARSTGLDICSGGIIGMGETMIQRIEMALELKGLGVLSIPLNILSPIKGTALEKMRPLDTGEILTAIALFRFINPSAYIRFAGGRGFIKPRQERALHAGINASIVGDMLTTCGSSSIDEDRFSFSAAGYILE